MKEKLITEKWLDKHNACDSGTNWFRARFPEGAEISDVLIGIACDLAANGSWIGWLMSRAKYTNTEWTKELPLSVGGSLYLSGTGITSLPDDLSVGGSLDLRGCKNIKKKNVPKNLKSKVVF